MSRRRNTHYTNQQSNRPSKAEREEMKNRGYADDDDALVDLVEVQKQATDFFEHYQKHLIIGATALLLIIGAYLGYKYGIQEPKEKESFQAMYKAQAQFEQDSFALALENPGGGFDGFLDIIEKYSGTKASNMAHYYAGVSYLNIGRYDEAINYLKDFSPSDDVLPIMKNGALGDAYAESGDKDKALSFYKKAANGDENDLLTPYYLNKVGLLSFQMGNNSDAVSAFKRIKENFSESVEGRDADKMIERLQ
jgi:tetratricopeptide (TPR) repeat protein